MNRANTEKLFRDFPKLFPKENMGDPRVSLMCFGFECGDGWFDIIYDLCSHIQDRIDHHWQSPSPKQTLRGKLINLAPRKWRIWLRKKFIPYKHIKMCPDQITVVQVKEKYGTLRFYTNTMGALVNEDDPKEWVVDHVMDGIIAHACYKSGMTCEICGERGRRYTSGWHTTLCDKHAKERGCYGEFDDQIDYTSEDPDEHIYDI